MVDYSKNYGWIEDQTHGDNYFNYGYLGEFKIDKTKSYEWSDYDGDGIVDYVQNGVNDDSVSFIASNQNLDMAAITTQYFDLYDDVAGNYENITQLLDGGALLNGMLPTSVYGLWRNIGYAYNGSNKSDNTQFRITAVGSADIGDHAISVGFEFEQRTDRSFGVSPVAVSYTHLTLPTIE